MKGFEGQRGVPRQQDFGDEKQVSDATALLCEDESLTIQSQAPEADINVIMKRFGVTGQAPTAKRLPQYGDFTGITDYRGAIEAVRAAEQQFMSLPAMLRARFENDPQQFLTFCENPDNIPALREMGLLPKVENDDGSKDRGAAEAGRGASSSSGESARSRAEASGEAGGESRSREGARGADAGGAARGR